MRFPDTKSQLLKRAWAAARERARRTERATAGRRSLAPGVELIGEYEGSGLKDPPYIVKRADGQVVQIPRLLFLIARALDGGRTTREIAAIVTEQAGRGMSADDVRYLIDNKLRPLGLVAGSGGSVVPAGRSDPFLALRMRAAIVPARFVRAASSLLRPFFLPLVVGAALAWLVAFDVWLFGDHGLSHGLRQVLGQPLLVPALLGLVLIATAWHELGHATACRYGGATPGPVGVGLYLVWPAFYTDVTDAYRLDRVGRLRTDLGGVYFNVLFMLATAGAYFATRFEPLLVLIALQHVQTIQQFIPFVRLDGYYVLTDLVGVPDILSRVRPILASLVPGRRVDPRVTELKPWVRATVTAYVLVLAVVLSGMFALMVVHAPRYFATASGALHTQVARASAALHADRLPEAGVAALRIVMVLLPAIGMALIMLRVLRLVGRLLGRRLGGEARLGFGGPAKVAFAFAAGCAAALLVANWGRVETSLVSRTRAAEQDCRAHRIHASSRCRPLLRRETARRRANRRGMKVLNKALRQTRRGVADAAIAAAAAPTYAAAPTAGATAPAKSPSPSATSSHTGRPSPTTVSPSSAPHMAGRPSGSGSTGSSRTGGPSSSGSRSSSGSGTGSGGAGSDSTGTTGSTSTTQDPSSTTATSPSLTTSP